MPLVSRFRFSSFFFSAHIQCYFVVSPLSFDSWLLCVENIAHLQRQWALKSRYTDRMADSINLKIDMDATWKKSRILQKTLKRDSISVKLHLIVQKNPSVRFKFFLFYLFHAAITWTFYIYRFFFQFLFYEILFSRNLRKIFDFWTDFFLWPRKTQIFILIYAADHWIFGTLLKVR